MVTGFERLDRTTLFLNLNLLLWVVLIPWSTALIAEHLRDGGADEAFAAAVYAANFLVMGFSFFAMWRHAGRARLVAISGDTLRALVLRNTIGQGGDLIALPPAWGSAPAALILFRALAAYH